MAITLTMGTNPVVRAVVTPAVVARSSKSVTIKYTIALDAMSGNNWWGLGVYFNMYDEDDDKIDSRRAQGTSAYPDKQQWEKTKYTMQITRPVGLDEGSINLKFQMRSDGGFMGSNWIQPVSSKFTCPVSYEAAYKGIVRYNGVPYYVYYPSGGKYVKTIPYYYDTASGKWVECVY